jgi:hypothetical protein
MCKFLRHILWNCIGVVFELVFIDSEHDSNVDAKRIFISAIAYPVYKPAQHAFLAGRDGAVVAVVIDCDVPNYQTENIFLTPEPSLCSLSVYSVRYTLNPDLVDVTTEPLECDFVSEAAQLDLCQEPGPGCRAHWN